MRPQNWDKYETALLLDAVLKVEAGKEEKKAAVVRVSSQLRRLAQIRHIDVDETYRNVNGIMFQYQSMEYSALGRVSSTDKKGSKIFDEIVDMWKHHPEDYNDILNDVLKTLEINIDEKERQAEIGMNNRDAFYQWIIQSGKTESFAKWTIESFDKISAYAINKKLSKINVFELSTEKDATVFCNSVTSYKLFRIMHKDLHKFLLKNGKLYSLFLKERKIAQNNQSDKPNAKIEIVVNSEADKALTEEYPNEYYRVFSELATNDREVYLTPNQIAERTEIPLQLVENILSQVSWAEKLGSGYILGKKSTAAKSISLNANAAYAEVSDIAKVLISAFKRGYRPSSIMDKKRFGSIFEEQTGDQIDEDEANRQIVSMCFRFDDRYFLPMAVVDEATSDEMIRFIEEYFGAKDILFYNVLYDRFSDRFNSFVYNAEMLCEYLKTAIQGTRLYYSDKYFSYNPAAKPDIVTEVKNYLIEAGKPCSYDEIYEALSHYTQDDIYSALHYNTPDILGNSKTSYFHVSVSGIAKNDIDNIVQTADKGFRRRF